MTEGATHERVGVVTALTSLPWWILLVGSLLFMGLATLGARAILTAFLSDGTHDAARYAAPLMPALGVLFAFISGFAITAMWATQSSAEVAVSQEASVSSTLAWAATAPGVDTAAIQNSLQSYLDSVVGEEWSRMQNAQRPASAEPLRGLERVVRASASDTSVRPSTADELLNSVDLLATRAGERTNAATRSIPLALFLAILFAGIALSINATVLTITGSDRARLITASVTVVVAIDLAVLLILASPFQGSRQVSDSPITAVQTQLRDGYFSR